MTAVGNAGWARFKCATCAAAVLLGALIHSPTPADQPGYFVALCIVVAALHALALKLLSKAGQVPKLRPESLLRAPLLPLNSNLLTLFHFIGVLGLSISSGQLLHFFIWEKQIHEAAAGAALGLICFLLLLTRLFSPEKP